MIVNIFENRPKTTFADLIIGDTFTIDGTNDLYLKTDLMLTTDKFMMDALNLNTNKFHLIKLGTIVNKIETKVSVIL